MSPGPEKGDQRKVALGPPRGRIDDQEERLTPCERRARQIHERVNVHPAEALLERVEREPGQLGLDEIRAIGHDGLEPLVSCGRLPLRHQMKHVLALRRKPRLAAWLARERHLQLGKHRQPRDGILRMV